ncbi:unnamed protein product, partial [marine sediment metagenome]
MKKKTLWMLLSFLLVAALVLGSCAKEVPGEQEEEEEEESPPEEVVTWKIQGFVPAGMLYHDTLEMFAKRVEDCSMGRLKLEIYPVGAMCGGFEGLKACSDGVFDVNYGY